MTCDSGKPLGRDDLPSPEEMCHAHAETLQRIGTLLGLRPGSSLHTACEERIRELIAGWNREMRDANHNWPGNVTQKTVSVSVGDGKYVVLHENGQNLRASREGKPWRNLVGDKLILALVERIRELEDDLGRAI